MTVPKTHDEHCCSSRRNEIVYLFGYWKMDDGHDGYIEIDYCPYCGKKL